MSEILHSLRIAARRLAHDRIGTLLGVLSVGLALGACTVATSLINAYLLQPPPHLDAPERLILLASKPFQIPGGPPGDFLQPLSYADYETYRKRPGALSDLAVYHPTQVNVSFHERTEKLPAQLVSANYFSLLGVDPAVGSFFAERNERVRGGGVVLGHDLWQREFAGSRDAVGSVLRVNGTPFTVLGVVPPGFSSLMIGEEVSLWATLAEHRALVPQLPDDLLADPAADWLFWFVGRLAPEAGQEGLQQQLDALAEASGSEELPALEVHGNLRLRPGTGEQVARSLGVLIVAVALALVVACSNLAALLSVGLARRRRELGLRMTLGAGRRHLVGLVISEASLLCLAGGTLGLLLGALGNEWMEGRAVVSFMPVSGELPIDVRVLMISLAVLLFAGLVAAVPPILRVLRTRPSALMEGASGGRGGVGKSHMEEVLLVVEVAISTVLLVGAGMLLLTLRDLERIDPGFSGQEILTVRLDLDRYSEASGRDFVRRLLERIEALPDVRSASAALQVPFTGAPTTARLAQLSMPGEPADVPQWISLDVVAPGYFETLGIPLLAGRAIDRRDGETTLPVAVVNARLDRLLGGDSLGRTLELGDRSYEVVGVAGDVLHRSFDAEAQPRVYVSLFQSFEGALFLEVATDSDALRLAASVRQAVWQLDPTVPVYGVEHLGRQIEAALSQQRIASRLVASCSALALILTAIGVFGLTARVVAGRAREVALRLALGAGRAAAVRLVTRRTLWLTSLGIVLGTLVSIVVGGVLRGSLHGVGPMGPLLFLAVALVVLVTSGLAVYVPVRRVLAVDPAATLRSE